MGVPAPRQTLYLGNPPIAVLDIRFHLDLDTEDVEGKRHYRTPEGLLYPSMTTVLSRYKEATSGDALRKWQASVGGVEKADKIRDAAGVFGTAIHDAAEAYIRGHELPKLDFFQRDRFNGLKKVIDKHVGKVYAVETALYTNRFKIAGRSDLLSEWDGVPSIVDWKNSNKPKQAKYISNYFLQGFGYGYMYRELRGADDTTPKQIVIVNTTPHEEPQIFVEKMNDWYKPFIDMAKLYA